MQRTAISRARGDLLTEDSQDLRSAAPVHREVCVVVLPNRSSLTARPLLAWEDPGIQFAITLLEGKWRVPILHQLQGGPVRVGELRRRLSPISKKVLNQHLREMAKDRLIIRTDSPGKVPQVEYSLAKPLGYAVLNLLSAVAEWGEQHFRQITGDPVRGESKLSSKI